MTSIGEASADVSCCHLSFTDLADVLFDKTNLSFIKHLFFFTFKEQIPVRVGFNGDHQIPPKGPNLPEEMLGKKKTLKQI